MFEDLQVLCISRRFRLIDQTFRKGEASCMHSNIVCIAPKHLLIASIEDGGSNFLRSLCSRFYTFLMNFPLELVESNCEKIFTFRESKKYQS